MTDMDETVVEAVAMAISRHTYALVGHDDSGDCGEWQDMSERARITYMQAARAAIAANPATARVAKLEEALQGLIDAIDAPRYGDDSIWNDLHGYGPEPGPLDIARHALASGEKP